MMSLMGVVGAMLDSGISAMRLCSPGENQMIVVSMLACVLSDLHVAVFCIDEVLAGSRSGDRKHDVMDVVRNLTSSRISAATALSINPSLQLWKEVGYGSKGDLFGSLRLSLMDNSVVMEFSMDWTLSSLSKAQAST